MGLYPFPIPGNLWDANKPIYPLRFASWLEFQPAQWLSDHDWSALQFIHYPNHIRWRTATMPLSSWHVAILEPWKFIPKFSLLVNPKLITRFCQFCQHISQTCPARLRWPTRIPGLVLCTVTRCHSFPCNFRPPLLASEHCEPVFFVLCTPHLAQSLM